MDLNTPKLPEGPLDTIKLLQLTWDENGSGLEGQLSDFTLSSCPPFTCVSYVWGETTKARGQTLESHCLSSSPDLLGPVTLKVAKDMEEINNYYSFLARFRDTTDRMERRFTVTDEGHVEITAAHARKGYMVCVLFGCSIPVVLRPVGVNGRYEFVGGCYLQGFMYGAAVGNGRGVRIFELV
jgi:hypothetical protein